MHAYCPDEDGHCQHGWPDDQCNVVRRIVEASDGPNWLVALSLSACLWALLGVAAVTAVACAGVWAQIIDWLLQGAGI